MEYESDKMDQQCKRNISEKAMGGVGGGAEDSHLTAGARLSTLKVIFLSCNSFFPAIVSPLQ